MRARLAQASESRISVAVEGPRGTGGTLDLVSPDPVWGTLPPNHDFVAVSLVQYAASEGCDLHVEGPVTSAQLERLDELQTIWSVWRPDEFQRISLSAEEEVPLPDPGDRGGAVMGFSGGVDAGFALAAHASGTLGRMSRTVDLGVLVVGWDLKHGDQQALDRARASARRALDEYGVRLAVVSTNWQQEFCNAWFMSFNSGLMSILHTFSASCSAAIHATDHSYRLELRMPPYGSNMAVNHLLGNPWFPVVSTGGTHRRVERVEFLRDHPVLLEELRVCYQADAGGTNCGHCEKCVRTQLELRAVGLSAQASGAFPSPMTVADLRNATVGNPTVLMHFEDILERLDTDDELRRPVARWVREHRPAKNPRLQELEARVATLQERAAGDPRGARGRAGVTFVAGHQAVAGDHGPATGAARLIIRRARRRRPGRRARGTGRLRGWPGPRPRTPGCARSAHRPARRRCRPRSVRSRGSHPRRALH